MRKWGTLLELKEHTPKIGFKGMVFFIVEFPRNIETDEIDYVIAQPTFSGFGVGPGIASFVLTKEKIEELFTVTEKTFEEYAQELQDDYFSEKE